MNLTSKSRYALKIMIDLACYGNEGQLVRRNEISARQGIPTDYLDQIMIRLRSGKLVASTRGRSGGYKLARAACEISAWDVFSSVEEGIVPVECIESGHVCDFENSCSSKDAWTKIFSDIRSSLKLILLSDLAGQSAFEKSSQRDLGHLNANNTFATKECRGGRSGILSGVLATSPVNASGATCHG